MKRPVLKHTHIIKLSRLLDMMYKPAEIAEEIGVSVDTIYRSYLPAGLPHVRDGDDIWIHGPAFVAWARETISKKKSERAGLAEDCMCQRKWDRWDSLLRGCFPVCKNYTAGSRRL